jgi:hypothetical protein
VGDPTKKSVISDPLDDLKFSDESFWKHLGEFKREPVYLPTWAKLLGVHIAKHEVSDRDDGSFVVQDVIGGYYGSEIDVTLIHSYDPDTNTWTQKSNRDPGLQKVDVTACFRLHSEPHRLIELWVVNELARNAGQPVADTLRWTVGGILEGLGKPNEGYEAKADQPSKDGSGNLVAQSSELDALMSPDEFIDSIQKSIKEGKANQYSVEFKLIEDSGDIFKTMNIMEHEGNRTTLYTLHEFDKAAGSMKSTVYEDDTFSVKLHAHCTKVHKSPFVVELHVESYPTRRAGEDVMKGLGDQVQKILEKAEADAGNGGYA